MNSGFRQPAIRAASTALVLNQDFLIEQKLDIPQGGVGRTFCQFCVVRGGTLALEAVKQAVDDFTLPFVDMRPAIDTLPALRL